MTLPKKGTRLIQVDDRKYRYKINPDSEFYIIVELDGAKGQLLKTSFKLMNSSGIQREITPGLIAVLIKEALRLGWEPEGKGIFNVDGEKVIEVYNNME